MRLPGTVSRSSEPPGAVEGRREHTEKGPQAWAETDYGGLGGISMSGEGTSHGPIYITRGMKAMCDCGTAPRGNYLNIVVDHGVITGPEQQPLLNANDHTTDTVIGFGNCKSGTNPKIQLQKGVMSFLLGGNPLACYRERDGRYFS